MCRSAYGTRIAHGALLVGYMSTLSTMICARDRGCLEPPQPLQDRGDAPERELVAVAEHILKWVKNA